MKNLTDTNVTEVTFLSGRVAVTFSSSFGSLGQAVSLAQLAAEQYYSEAVWTLTLQPAESWGKLLLSSASHQCEIHEPHSWLNIQLYPCC